MTRTERNHVRAVARLERAERKLVRAFTEWNKLRRSVRGYERRLDWRLLAEPRA